MTNQSNAAAERSAHVTRGSGAVPAEWPVVQLPDGSWQLKAVAELQAEIEKLRAALHDVAKHVWRGDMEKLRPETRAVLGGKE